MILILSFSKYQLNKFRWRWIYCTAVLHRIQCSIVGRLRLSTHSTIVRKLTTCWIMNKYLGIRLAILLSLWGPSWRWYCILQFDFGLWFKLVHYVCHEAVIHLCTSVFFFTHVCSIGESLGQLRMWMEKMLKKRFGCLQSSTISGILPDQNWNQLEETVRTKMPLELLRFGKLIHLLKVDFHVIKAELL